MITKLEREGREADFRFSGRLEACPTLPFVAR